MGGDLKIMKAIKSGALTGSEISGAGFMTDGDPLVCSNFNLPVNNRSNINLALDSLVKKVQIF